MSQEYAKALQLITQMMTWELTIQDDQVRWEASDRTITLDKNSCLTWLVNPRDGGPVRIEHTVDLRDADLDDLVEIARDLLGFKGQVEHNGPEREEYESEVRRAALSLLRRKSANGIRLVKVVSEPIATSNFSNVLAEVTLEIDTPHGLTQATYVVGDADELRDEFDTYIEQLKQAGATGAPSGASA